MLKKFYILDFFKYHLIKVLRIFNKKITKLFLIYYKNKLPESLLKIMKNNRKFLKTINEFIPESEYHPENNNYGIQNHIYLNLKKDIDLFPTNTDILIYLLNQIGLSNLNYLEIGTSVFKNFQQIDNVLNDSILFAYDINEPVSIIKQKYDFNIVREELSGQKYLYSKRNNEIIYFKNDVLSKDGAEIFKNLLKQNIDVVFSDALHSEEGILSEYFNIIKGNLSENFIYYFDDLNLYDVQSGVEKIFKDLNLHKKHSIKFFTFWTYGWVGQHEALHKIGLITNIDFAGIFKQQNLKLPFFKEIIDE